MMGIAVRSKHLTPSLLTQEFKKIGKSDIPLYVSHMKPTGRDCIIQKLGALDIPNLTVLEGGQELELYVCICFSHRSGFCSTTFMPVIFTLVN